MNTLKQAIFVNKKTGYLYSDINMEHQLLCKKHNSPVIRGLTNSILGMYLSGCFICEKKRHRLIFKAPFEIFEVEA